MDGNLSRYSENSFWRKLQKHAKIAGYEVVQKGLWLFYAAAKPETPRWAKTTIYAALGYYIFPMDVVPDVLAGIGYTDDLGALSVAIATCAAYIDLDVKKKAEQKLKNWFG